MQVLDLKESRARGSYGFPVELYEIGPRHPRYHMSYHWHPEMEIIRVNRGSFTYMLDDRSGMAQAGDLLFVNSGSLHAGVPMEGCLYDCVVFDLSLLHSPGPAAGALQKFAQHKWLVQPCLPRQDAELQTIACGIFTALLQKAPGHQLMVQGGLLQFFGHVLAQGYYSQNTQQSHGAFRKTQQLKQVLALIENDYDAHLSLEELASTAGMTPKYFCHFFRSMTGRTPIDYLNRHRIETACSRIAAGENHITEVAYDCGFNDLSYFIRVFKRYKNVTPKQYCKQFV